jgi:Rrf2 family protein
MPSGQPRNLELHRRIATLRAAGLSLGEIGRELGVSRQAVHSALTTKRQVPDRSCACAGCGAVIVSDALLPRERGHAFCVTCVDTDPAATFGQRLKAHRLAAGLTILELAQRSKVFPGCIPTCERGAIDPLDKTRARLAAALGVTAERLGLRAGPVEGGRGPRPAWGRHAPFRVTRGSLHALQALAALAAGDGRPVLAHHLARECGISEQYMFRVLVRLVRAGILRATRGDGRGYRLTRPASRITLLDVIEAVDRPVRAGAPRHGAKTARPLDAKLQEVCELVTNQARQQLGRVKLSELVKRGGKK